MLGLLDMVFGVIGISISDWVYRRMPIERQLEYAQKKGEDKFRKIAKNTNDISVIAAEASRMLATIRASETHLKRMLDSANTKAAAAQRAGDANQVARLNAQAESFARQLASTQSRLSEQEARVKAYMGNEQRAINMVVRNSIELEERKGSDALLIQQAKMNEIDSEMLKTREALVGLLGDNAAENVRPRVEAYVNRDRDRITAREKLVGALEEAHGLGEFEDTGLSDEAARILAESRQRTGYQHVEVPAAGSVPADFSPPGEEKTGQAARRDESNERGINR